MLPKGAKCAGFSPCGSSCSSPVKGFLKSAPSTLLSPAEPEFGPLVPIANETEVAPAPAEIVLGTNEQLLLKSVASAGVKLQVNVTLAANVIAPAGAAVNV